MILVTFTHALRASEVLAITKDDLYGGFLYVHRLKGSNQTNQPLLGHDDPVFDERSGLVAFAQGMGGKQRLFPITRQRYWQIMQKYSEAAGIPRHLAHPHVLKHSIGMQLIGPAGIEHTRIWMGHKSMSSTGEYLKPTEIDAANAAARALRGSGS
jgi:integrase